MLTILYTFQTYKSKFNILNLYELLKLIYYYSDIAYSLIHIIRQLNTG